MLRPAHESALIHLEAVWTGCRLHDPRGPKGQEPGPMAGKESYHVRRNTPNLALEGEVLARDSGTDDCPHLCRYDRTLPSFDDCSLRNRSSGIAKGGPLPSPSANSSLLTANCSSPRLCPAALPPLARPVDIRPDACARSPGALGEVAGPRTQPHGPCRHPYRRLQRPRARRTR